MNSSSRLPCDFAKRNALNNSSEIRSGEHLLAVTFVQIWDRFLTPWLVGLFVFPPIGWLGNRFPKEISVTFVMSPGPPPSHDSGPRNLKLPKVSNHCAQWLLDRSQVDRSNVNQMSKTRQTSGSKSVIDSRAPQGCPDKPFRPQTKC